VVNGNAIEDEDEDEDEARWPPRAGPTELPNVAPDNDNDTDTNTDSTNVVEDLFV
jgi:hypothetical protein